jgi:Family of unknown function (DUF6502)
MPISAQDTPPAGRTGLPAPGLAAGAMGQILQPLARLMIDHGLQLPSVVELLKQALVSEAVAGYGLGGKGSSDTRISLLTGVHRKDVRRLRDLPPQAAPVTPAVTLSASVVARWISEPKYLGADQSPRPLARTPGLNAPGESDFTSLVGEVTRDVGPRAVLDELLRLGVVELQEGRLVTLKAAAFVPREGLNESFHFLAANVSDHLASAVHNLAPDHQGALMLEQSAFSEGLSAAQAHELHQHARHLWTGLLQQFLQTAAEAEQKSPSEEGPRHRVRFGAYFHEAVQP